MISNTRKILDRLVWIITRRKRKCVSCADNCFETRKQHETSFLSSSANAKPEAVSDQGNAQLHGEKAHHLEDLRASTSKSHLSIAETGEKENT